MGMIRPTEGHAKVLGLDAYSDSAKAHEMISYLPGETRLFRGMRGTHILSFLSRMHPHGNYEDALKIADRLEVDLNRKVSDCSSGMRQKISLASVLSVNCSLIILDEPTTHLDPSARQIVIELVKEAQQAGKTILFSSHVFAEIEDACDEVTILREGSIVYENSLDSIVSEHQIIGRRIDKNAMALKLSEVPETIRDSIVEIKTDQQEVTIQVKGDLALALSYLQELDLENLTINQTGLKQVYVDVSVGEGK